MCVEAFSHIVGIPRLQGINSSDTSTLYTSVLLNIVLLYQLVDKENNSYIRIENNRKKK